MNKYKAFFTLFIWALFYGVISFAQVPPNYYNPANGLSGTALQVALHNIIDNHNPRGFDQLWTDFQVTDDTPNGKVWDIYSDIPGASPPYVFTFISDQCGTYSQEGDCYNREHTFPQSWFNDANPMKTDLFQVMPTDGFVNGMRGNYPYGEVGSTTFISQNGSKVGSCNYPGYSGTVFEPIDDYKGDLARNYFYMATRYYGEDAGWPGSPMVNGSQLVEWAENMLMEWHASDPVSQKEIDRNNSVYALQNNRNPFIDHPEYANLIWGDGFASEPLNHPADFSAHTIVLNWTDAIGGVLPDAYLVRMSNVGFASIAIPVDGIPVMDNFWNKNVQFGEESCIFGGLTENTIYYFKIFGYSGSGSGIDYKTDGTIQQISIQSN